MIINIEYVVDFTNNTNNTNNNIVFIYSVIMSFYGNMERPTNDDKTTVVSKYVFDKEKMEKLIKDNTSKFLTKEEIDKLINDSKSEGESESKSTSVVGNDNIYKMIVNYQRCKLYSNYFFSTEDEINFYISLIHVNNSYNVTKGGRTVTVTSVEQSASVRQWTNCSRKSLSDETENMLNFIDGGLSDSKNENYVIYTKVQNNGYMKKCVKFNGDKHLKTPVVLKNEIKIIKDLSGKITGGYTFYFSFRSRDVLKDIFFFNYEGILGVFNTGKKLYVSVYDKKLEIDADFKDKWYVITVCNNVVWLDGVNVGAVPDTENKINDSKHLMLNGPSYISDIILFTEIHDDDTIKDMTYWLTNK